MNKYKYYKTVTAEAVTFIEEDGMAYANTYEISIDNDLNVRIWNVHGCFEGYNKFVLGDSEHVDSRGSRLWLDYPSPDSQFEVFVPEYNQALAIMLQFSDLIEDEVHCLTCMKPKDIKAKLFDEDDYSSDDYNDIMNLKDNIATMVIERVLKRIERNESK